VFSCHFALQHFLRVALGHVLFVFDMHREDEEVVRAVLGYLRLLAQVPPYLPSLRSPGLEVGAGVRRALAAHPGLGSDAKAWADAVIRVLAAQAEGEHRPSPGSG
jgi:hypothetical protein